MKTRIIHPLLHDEGGTLDFVLVQLRRWRPLRYSVTFEGAGLCENVSLGEAIQTMLTHVADVAQEAFDKRKPA